MANAGQVSINPAKGRRILIFVGLAVLVLASILLGLKGAEPGFPGIWFVGLLVMALSALAAAAAVFAGLKLASPKEAFGLPSGSIRALIAIGIMVLLVVFGLKFLNGDDKVAKMADQSLPTVIAPTADQKAVDDLKKAYESAGFTVVQVNEGELVAAPGAAPAAAKVPAPARLELYPKTAARPADETDLMKQLMTALITLLTSVVGFYFGSKGTTDGLKAGAPPPTSPPAPTLPGPTPQLALQRKQVGDSFAAADGPAQKAEQQLDLITAKPALPDPAAEANRQQLQTAAATTRKSLDAARTAIQAALATADSAISPSGGAGADAATASGALKTAGDSLAQLSALSATLTQQVQALTNATAEG